MMARACSVLLAIVAPAAAMVHIGPDGTFRDELGRQKVFHGLNVVNKSPPYYKSLTDEQLDTMITHAGFNAVRVGVMLDGLLPTDPTTVNTTYLAETKKIVDNLWARGVYSVLDLHQDIFSAKLCGEGFPSWAPVAQGEGVLPFPMPGGKPLPHDKHGVPEGCGANGGAWWQYYIADATGKSFQRLYDGKNDSGLREAMKLHWTTVAEAFRHHPGVLAYELLNEPWVGDHVGHPLRLAHPVIFPPKILQN